MSLGPAGPVPQGMEENADLVRVIERLKALQTNAPDKELQLAIIRCEEALHWLWARFAIRMASGR